MNHLSLFWAITLCVNAVHSMQFLFDSSITKHAEVDKETHNRVLRIDKVAYKIDDMLDTMYHALTDRQADPVSKACRRTVLGPLNERQDIKGDLYQKLEDVIRRIGVAKVVVEDLSMAMHTRGGYISLTEYSYTDPKGVSLSTKSLHIAEKLFSSSEDLMFEYLLAAVISVVCPGVSAQEFVIRKNRNPTAHSGEYEVNVHLPGMQLNPQLDEVVPGTWSGGSYDLLLSQPSGVKAAYLNPNVYIAFIQCLQRHKMAK